MKRSIDSSGNSGIAASLKLPRLSSPKESTTACPIESIEIKSLLRKKLLQRISSSDIRATQREKDQGVTENWCHLLLEEGYSSEVASIDNKDSPLLGEQERDCTELIDFVLVVYPSKKSIFEKDIGPFRSVRLLIFPNGAWKLQSELLNFRNLEEGKLSQSGESTAELITLVRSKFASTYVLCPGLVGLKDVEGTLGYLPSKVLHTSRNTAHSNTCKFWHIPSGKGLAGASSYDPHWSNVCSECHRAVTYINRKVIEKAEMEPEMKYRRQDPSSNYKVKYLSPGSATVRYNSLRLQRTTMKKKNQKGCPVQRTLQTYRCHRKLSGRTKRTRMHQERGESVSRQRWHLIRHNSN